MNGLLKEIKDTFKFGTALTRFIYINLGIFIFFRIIYVILYLISGSDPSLAPMIDIEFRDWLGLSSVIPALILKPWTLVTYMLYHDEIMHIAFNMVALFWFGKIFLMYFDNRKFTAVYLLGGLGGALSYLLFYLLFPKLGPANVIGASASVVAIIVAVSLYAPNFRLYLLFFGEVKLIYIAAGTILIDIIMLATSNTGGHVAHLGGALFGYLWVARLKKGKDFTVGFSRMIDGVGSLFKRRKMKVTHSKPPVNDFDYNRVKTINQKEIDRILDKISKGGYDSLSKEEKDTLFRLGKQ